MKTTGIEEINMTFNEICSMDKKKTTGLKSIANIVGYKNIIPTYPRAATASLLMGYHKRMFNWIFSLNTAIKEFKAHNDEIHNNQK